jgi:hypothetical protein
VFYFSNVYEREQAYIWGVTCDIDFNYNVKLAMMYLSLIESSNGNCPIENPLQCEIDEFVKKIKNDKIFKCVVDELCEKTVII